MKSLKTISFKLLLILLMLVAFNYLYKYTFFEKDIQAHSPVINLVRKVVHDKCEIVYLGESSNNTFRADDLDKRAISDFIADYYPAIKAGDITHGACHAGIYYELLRNIPENSTIKTVVVTLNLRSFDANWIYSNLETSLQKSIVLLKDRPPLLSRFLLAFKGYDIKTDSEREKQFKKKWSSEVLHFPWQFDYKNVIEWDKAMFHNGIINPDGSKNDALTTLACHYIKTYAFQIDTLNNPRIRDLDKIVLLAKQRHWNLVLNLMAENVEMADSLVGKEIVFLMRENRDLLVNRYNRNNIIVVENLEKIESSQYIDQNWTTEHYAEAGRKIIAGNVAESLKKFYPDDYKKVNYIVTRPTEFFNDCEGKTIWGGSDSYTSEQAFSGQYSSRTGQKHDFSLTFEYPLKNLPDSLKEASINFQLLAAELDPNAKLVFQISGENIKYQWKGVNISDFASVSPVWHKAEYTFSLPPDFYNADLIKIYVYNPTSTVLYVDDFRIVFKK